MWGAGDRVLWLAHFCNKINILARAVEIFADESAYVSTRPIGCCGQMLFFCFAKILNSSGGCGLEPTGWNYALGGLEVVTSGKVRV